MTTAHQIIRDPAKLVAFVAEWFGVEITVKEAEAISGKYRPQRSWNTCTAPFMWLKNRLCELGVFSVEGLSPDTLDADTARLHVFLIYVTETAAMLARIRRSETAESRVARSKIGSTELIVHPINATATKVAPVVKDGAA